MYVGIIKPESMFRHHIRHGLLYETWNHHLSICYQRRHHETEDAEVGSTLSYVNVVCIAKITTTALLARPVNTGARQILMDRVIISG